MKLYAEISKTEELDDGTIKVWGYASTGAVDSDGEIITPDAMKAALPDYMKFGAVREMHQSKAAGTAIEAKVEADGKTWFGAHIVDSEAVKKVKLNVYKGFSIGGKVTERDDLNKSIIKGLRLVEVSLVDRPANPEAVMTMFKADRTAEEDVTELAAMLDAGTITPGRLVDLAKAALVLPEMATQEVAMLPAEAPVAKADETPDLAKYAGEEVMDAGMALQALNAIMYLYGKESEEPGEPPEQVAALRAAIANLKTFIASEVQENNSDEAEADMGAEVEMADAIADLAKAGAKYSAATKKALFTVHQSMKECVAHLDGMGYDGADKADAADDISKADDTTITKLSTEIDTLKAEITELKKQPLPGKALLKAITVAKGDDSTIKTEADDPAQLLKGEALALHQLKTMFRGSAR